MQGLKIAALYSFPPGRFGLCGMGEESSHEILDFLKGEKVPNIKEILETFEGSLFYYKLIAKENKISNHFDERIVRAYWIGNELLEKVRISKLREVVEKNLKKPKLAEPMKRDLIMTEGMKDLCKISWGKILKIEDCKMQIANLIVEYQPLLKERKWFLGKPIKRRIFWFKSILPKVKVGDFVSFHWDLALEKLTKKDLENLKKYTQLSIEIANCLKK
jgi:hypothetical protein